MSSILAIDLTKVKSNQGEEMLTNTSVESSFWNFDALFVPQPHPAQELKDTFYLSEPSHANVSPPDPGYLERVAKEGK